MYSKGNVVRLMTVCHTHVMISSCPWREYVLLLQVLSWLIQRSNIVLFWENEPKCFWRILCWMSAVINWRSNIYDVVVASPWAQDHHSHQEDSRIEILYPCQMAKHWKDINFGWPMASFLNNEWHCFWLAVSFLVASTVYKVQDSRMGYWV